MTTIRPDALGDAVLQCVGLRKSYPGENAFVLGGDGDGLSFSVNRGELFALVGPSGCGKSTTLGIIGGFIRPDAGAVVIDGHDVTHRPPYARPTNTVFQSYALFPHLSVGANVTFGLAMEGMPRRERRTRAREALELVGLDGLERRRIAELSGGQQQRAALARALAKKPVLLLLDEPMGSLDAQLRKQMQDELVRLKTSMQTTFIHVTHDQEEACAIADRIGVMKDGKLVQVDAPRTLYQQPKDSYVARFLDIGTIIRGRSTRYGDLAEVSTDEITVRAPVPSTVVGGRVAVVIPVDKVRVRPIDRGSGNAQVTGVIARIVHVRMSILTYVRVGPQLEVKASLTPDEVAALGPSLRMGACVGLDWRPEDVIVVADGTDDEGPGGSTSQLPEQDPPRGRDDDGKSERRGQLSRPENQSRIRWCIAALSPRQRNSAGR